MRSLREEEGMRQCCHLEKGKDCMYHLVTKEGKGRENMVTETKTLGEIIWSPR
jgi:hypothetical protein